MKNVLNGQLPVELESEDARRGLVHTTALHGQTIDDRDQKGDGADTRSFDRLFVAVDHSWPHGGFTLSLEGYSPNCGDDDFIVSLWGFEQKFPSKPCREDLVAYLVRSGSQLRLAGRYLGGSKERSGGHVIFVLDVSMVIPGLEPAIAFARRHHQRAVYSPSTQQTVQVEYPAALAA